MPTLPPFLLQAGLLTIVLVQLPVPTLAGTGDTPVSIASTAFQQPAVEGSQSPTALPNTILSEIEQIPLGPVIESPALGNSEEGIAASTQVQPIEPLIKLADSMMRSGGYREAAKAYAQLAVRFGDSNRLYTRRFIAQVSSGDWRQAAVILEIALIAGFEISSDELPAGTLEALFEREPQITQRVSEELAAQALEFPNDPGPLSALGTWLRLAGNETKARLFLKRASDLAGQDQLHGLLEPPLLLESPSSGGVQ